MGIGAQLAVGIECREVLRLTGALIESLLRPDVSTTDLQIGAAAVGQACDRLALVVGRLEVRLASSASGTEDEDELPF